MKKTLCLTLAALAVTAGTANGQTKFEFGLAGGISEPSGDFSNVAKLGWHGFTTVGVLPSGIPLAIQAAGFFGENSFDAGGGKFQLAGALGELRLGLRTGGQLKPYVLAGGGVIDVKEAPDTLSSVHQTRGAIDGGIGLLFFAHKRAGFFIEARWVNVFTDNGDTQFVPITAGVRFTLR